MTDAVLSGADLSGANLEGANLGSAKLTGIKVKDTNMRGVKLSNTSMEGVDLSDADPTGAKIVISVDSLPDDMHDTIRNHEKWMASFGAKGKRAVLDGQLIGGQFEPL